MEHKQQWLKRLQDHGEVWLSPLPLSLLVSVFALGLQLIPKDTTENCLHQFCLGSRPVKQKETCCRIKEFWRQFSLLRKNLVSSRVRAAFVSSHFVQQYF